MTVERIRELATLVATQGREAAVNGPYGEGWGYEDEAIELADLVLGPDDLSLIVAYSNLWPVGEEMDAERHIIRQLERTRLFVEQGQLAAPVSGLGTYGPLMDKLAAAQVEIRRLLDEQIAKVLKR